MRSIGNTIFCQLLAVGFVCIASGPSPAATGCADLSQIGPTSAVDFTTQIQSIFNASCTGCHIGGAQGGLALDPGVAYDNLVDVPSGQNGQLIRVVPSDPGSSLLFQKLNCSQPDVGTAMPPTGALPLATQALVRDWIDQGALAAPHVNSDPIAVDDTAATPFDTPVVIDVLANDSDLDDDQLTVIDVGNAAHGYVVISGTTVTYTPDPSFFGESDFFNYSISDGNGGSDVAMVSVAVGAPPFEINFGIGGSWFNRDTNGQGFSIEIVPAEQSSRSHNGPDVMVVYWFTYSVDGSALQWLIGVGPIWGNRVEFGVPGLSSLERPENGVFDDPMTPGFLNWGTMTIQFDSCSTGSVIYNSDLDGVAGSFDIERILPDVLCEILAAEP